MEPPQRMLAPERLIMTAIELDHAPDAVWAAIDELAGERLGTLMEILRLAPPRSWVANDAWHRAIDGDRLRELLDAEDPDLETLEQVLAGVEAPDAGVLLDLLTESDSLATRKRLFARLTELAPHIGAEIIRRLRDTRWYARRNMLALLGELERWPPKWSPAELSDDPHPAVRREALKLLLRLPEHRGRAVCGLLQDGDRRAVSLGLAAATEECPPEAVDLLAAIGREETTSDELRVMAVRALGQSTDGRAIAPLVELARRGSGLAPNRLAEKSPVLLAALHALASFTDLPPEATKLLARAASSSDEDIRETVARGDGGR